MQHCSMRPALDQWKDCEELKTKPKGLWVFADNRVVCGSRRVSMYEMWKRKQIHEDARNMYRTKILVGEFGKW